MSRLKMRLNKLEKVSKMEKEVIDCSDGWKEKKRSVKDGEELVSLPEYYFWVFHFAYGLIKNNGGTSVRYPTFLAQHIREQLEKNNPKELEIAEERANDFFFQLQEKKEKK